MNWMTLFAGPVGANELAFTVMLALTACLQHFSVIAGQRRAMQAAPVPVTLPVAQRRRR